MNPERIGEGASDDILSRNEWTMEQRQLLQRQCMGCKGSRYDEGPIGDIAPRGDTGPIGPTGPTGPSYCTKPTQPNSTTSDAFEEY